MCSGFSATTTTTNPISPLVNAIEVLPATPKTSAKVIQAAPSKSTQHIKSILTSQTVPNLNDCAKKSVSFAPKNKLAIPPKQTSNPVVQFE